VNRRSSRIESRADGACAESGKVTNRRRRRTNMTREAGVDDRGEE
jgi:hypothetical protein